MYLHLATIRFRISVFCSEAVLGTQGSWICERIELKGGSLRFGGDQTSVLIVMK